MSYEEIRRLATDIHEQRVSEDEIYKLILSLGIEPIHIDLGNMSLADIDKHHCSRCAEQYWELMKLMLQNVHFSYIANSAEFYNDVAKLAVIRGPRTPPPTEEHIWQFDSMLDSLE